MHDKCIVPVWIFHYLGSIILISPPLSLQLEGAGVKLVVGAVLGHEFFVGAAFDDAAVIEDHDDVGILNGGEAVGDDEDGAAFHEGIHAALNEGFGTGVDGGGGFIKDHHRWIADGGPGDGKELSLALAESGAVTGKDGVIALRQHADKAVGIGQFGGGDAIVVCGLRIAVTDVLHDGVGKKVDVLKHDAEGASQVVFADVFDVDAVIENGAVVDVVKPVDEVCNGGFTGSCSANEGNFLPRFGVEGDVVEDLFFRSVAKIDVFQAHIAAQAAVFGLAGVIQAFPCPNAGASLAFCKAAVGVFADVDKHHVAVVFLVGFIHQGENTGCAGKRGDDGVKLAGNLGHRHGKIARQGEEAGDHANGHNAGAAEAEIHDAANGHGCTNKGNNDVLQIAETVHDWHHRHGMAVGEIGGLFPGFVAATHFLFGFAFVAKNFNDFFAVDDFFHIAVEGGKGGLLLHKVGAGNAGDFTGNFDHAKDAGDHEQRQPNADGEHGNKDGDQREEGAHRRREGLAHHLAQGVHVVGVKAHDVAVFVAVKIANRQPLHLSEHVVAHAFHGALRHKGHDPVIGQGGDDASA